MLHKLANDFLKIVNCLPSTCAQSALTLRKCKEQKIYFTKMKMNKKEHI